MATKQDEPMTVRRLGWAGIEIAAEGSLLVVDLLEDGSSMAPYAQVEGPLPPPSRLDAVGALVTHLHPDHADPPAIGRALARDGTVVRPAPARGDGLETAGTATAEAGFGEAGFDTFEPDHWEAVQLGPFKVTAVPAVDGFGDPQVSFVVEAAGRRIFHGGDTIFHGSWWLIGMRCGSVDAAFLPVNGPVCDFPHRQPPSPLPAAMDPLQAAVAASVLRAPLAVPIHYDAIHSPPVYAQVDAPAETFAAAAVERGVVAQVLEPGESLRWAA